MEQLYHPLLETLHDIVFITDHTSRMLFANPALERQTGFRIEDFQFPQSDNPFLHPDDADRVGTFIAEFLESPEAYSGAIENRFFDRWGQIHWYSSVISKVDYAGQPALQFVAREVTERRLQEEALVQTQKLESLGLLAGGIAHDFNNLLTAILGQSSLALDLLPSGSPAKKHIQKVVLSSERAADLVRQLLAYSGCGRTRVEPIRLDHLIRENTSLLETVMPKHVSTNLQLPEESPWVLADRGQVQQVIMNLIINGAEAIPEAGGVVAVSMGTKTLKEGEGVSYLGGPDLSPGPYVVLDVSDTGCGMEPATLARIFDPFFTTKTHGRGLGLSAVLGIVRSHGGGMQVKTEPGKGTQFSLLFPATEAPCQGEAPDIQDLLTGPLSMLVIDDQAGVREMASDALVAAGVAVRTAADGAEGCRIFAKDAAAIQAVLLDWHMPKMSGRQVLLRLWELDPTVRVLVSSGRDVTADFPQAPYPERLQFLPKPYTKATLIQALQNLVYKCS